MYELHFYPRSMCLSGGLNYLILSLPVRPFSGLVGEATPPPINFTLPLLRPAYALDFFIFTRFVVKHLGSFLLLASKPCLIWKVSWGIRSTLEGPFGCFICWLFWRGLQSGQVNLGVLSAWPGTWIYVLILFMLSLLLPGCLVHSSATGWRLSCGIILVPWFPSDTKGSEVFGGTALRLRLMSLGFASLSPGIVVPWWINSHGEILTSLQQDVFALLPCIM